LHEYDLIADWYATDRGAWAGVPEATALAQSLARGARVLDIGCGHGQPLTSILVDHGCRVVALDSSSQMLQRFHRHFPTVPAIRGQIQNASFADDSFDAAHAWGVIFHLTLDEQRAAIANVARILKPGAPFVFTSGDNDQGYDGPPREGHMNGVMFRYYAFSRADYADILASHDMALIDTHTDRGQTMYYLARKGEG
jgi:SAM-dependent methyltransferase